MQNVLRRKKGPKLSVIVPVYKVEKYLRKCIESILKQTFTDFELLLIDDGSPDNCPVICDEYAEKDFRVKVFHQPNGGVSSARNTGLKNATGEWIGFIDSDDYIESKAYQMLIEAAESNACDAAIMDFCYVDEYGNVPPGKERIYGEKMLLSRKEAIAMQFDIPLSIRLVMFNKMFKRNILDGLFFDENIHCAEDTLLLSKCLERIQRAVFIREPLYKNVQREGSAMHGGLKIKDIEKSLSIHKNIAIRTGELYPDLFSYAYAYYIDSCIWKMRMYGKSNSLLLREQQENKYYYLKMRKRLRYEVFGIIKCDRLSWKQKIRYILIGVTG